MKFLLDSCAGRRLAEWLRARGFDVVRVADRGGDPGDAAILAWAVGEGRILITMDKDFGALVYKEQLGHAGLIRLPHCPPDERIRLMEQILARHDAEDLQGAIVTVRGTRIRIVLASS